MTTIYREDVDAVYRTSFGAFVCRAFEVAQSWTKAGIQLAHRLHLLIHWSRWWSGRSNNRLVVNLPPRTLKTYIISICLVAWLLGRDPTLRIICASYSEDLAAKLSRDCRSSDGNEVLQATFPSDPTQSEKSHRKRI